MNVDNPHKGSKRCATIVFYINGCVQKKEVQFVSSGINSSPPCAAHMRPWTGSALVQVMACHLFGAKPLPKPMQAYCQLDTWEQISVKFEWEFYIFHSRKCIWKCRLPEWRPFCPGGDKLISFPPTHWLISQPYAGLSTARVTSIKLPHWRGIHATGTCSRLLNIRAIYICNHSQSACFT